MRLPFPEQLHLCPCRYPLPKFRPQQRTPGVGVFVSELLSEVAVGLAVGAEVGATVGIGVAVGLGSTVIFSASGCIFFIPKE